MAVALLALSMGADSNLPCVPASTTISLAWNAYASKTGLYTVDGCSGVSPKLQLNIGTTYTFKQLDISNWYHPVGFAYEPGGAHNSCGDQDECPEVEAPELQYFIDGEAITSDESGFGLDAYEPMFFYPEEEWATHNFTATLTITRTDLAKIYYFCHIHSGMSAVIELVGADDTATEPEYESLFVAPPVISEWDEACGTVDVEEFADSHSTCSGKHFLCGTDAELESDFNQCMVAIDCKMHHDMAVEADGNPVKTFLRQMISHHENAVNMAKVLLKHASASDMASAEAWDEVTALTRAIINVQNHQIQTMEGLLDGDDGELCYAECPSGCVPEVSTVAAARRRELLFASSPNGCPEGCVAEA